jgi:hypothetical protein
MADRSPGDLNMNSMIRGGFTALSLMAGFAQMAHAATYGTRQQPLATGGNPQGTTNVQTDRTYAIQNPMAPGANERIGAGSVQTPTRKTPLQSGNDFNWLEGGGG